MSETTNLTEGVDTIRDYTVAIVSAYVSANHIAPTDLPAFIQSVHNSLSGLATGASATPAEDETEKPSPSQIRKSIRPDGLISFIDGKSYKTLKRHLTKHGPDPHTYRERYGLPANYPTTSTDYSAHRSKLARSFGLGQTRQEAEPEPSRQAPARSRRKTVA